MNIYDIYAKDTHRIMKIAWWFKESGLKASFFTIKVIHQLNLPLTAPTNYTDFVATTPRPNQSYPDLQNSDVKVTKIVRKSRNASASPHAERKISTGSNSSMRSGARRAPQERQPIMVASIAAFDHQPRKFSSVKAPNFRKAISTQTTHSNPGSDYDSDFTPPGDISISIKTDQPGHQLQAIRRQTNDTCKVVVDVTDQGLVTRGNSDDVADERIAESPQLFIPPSPPPPPTETPPPPEPPTPLPERKKLNAKADEFINQHYDLIKDFPPVPACVAKSPHFPEIRVNIGRRGPPAIPRKDRINHANVHKMKVITAKNACEVHRRKSPQHGPDPNACVGTPIFSDAEGTSIVSHSIFSDGHSTDGEQQRHETIGESKIPVMTIEASHSSAHDDTELESVKGFGWLFKQKN